MITGSVALAIASTTAVVTHAEHFESNWTNAQPNLAAANTITVISNGLYKQWWYPANAAWGVYDFDYLMRSIADNVEIAFGAGTYPTAGGVNYIPGENNWQNKSSSNWGFSVQPNWTITGYGATLQLVDIAYDKNGDHNWVAVSPNGTEMTNVSNLPAGAVNRSGLGVILANTHLNRGTEGANITIRNLTLDCNRSYFVNKAYWNSLQGLWIDGHNVTISNVHVINGTGLRKCAGLTPESFQICVYGTGNIFNTPVITDCTVDNVYNPYLEGLPNDSEFPANNCGWISQVTGIQMYAPSGEVVCNTVTFPSTENGGGMFAYNGGGTVSGSGVTYIYNVSNWANRGFNNDTPAYGSIQCRIYLYNNHFYNTRYWGVFARESTESYCSDNVITLTNYPGMSACGIQILADGVYGASLGADNWTVSYNDISGEDGWDWGIANRWETGSVYSLPITIIGNTTGDLLNNIGP